MGRWPPPSSLTRWRLFSPVGFPPVPVTQEQVDHYRIHESITPSLGFLSSASLANHPWICHMCRKKFMSADSLPEHIVSSKHVRRRSFNYRFEEWINYNRTMSFYEMLLTPAAWETQ